MARPTQKLIDALLESAARLRAGGRYQWGHMGDCNCGHLVQSLTDLTREEIHNRAMLRYGDWREQSVEYCPTSGFPLDDIITMLLGVGMERGDIRNLEWLDDDRVLRRVREAHGRRKLRRNNRDDVILYMETWAALLQEQLGARRVSLDDARAARAGEPEVTERASLEEISRDVA